MDDVFVYLVQLPSGIHEFVRPCADGFTIYIDIDLPEEERIEAYNHAMRHIKYGHFDYDNEKTVQEMELEVHGRKPIKASKFEEQLKRIREEREKLQKKIDRYYKRMERRQKKLAEQGYKEITVIEDGDYGEPVVRRKVIKCQDEDVL